MLLSNPPFINWLNYKNLGVLAGDELFSKIQPLHTDESYPATYNSIGIYISNDQVSYQSSILQLGPTIPGT